MANRFKKKTFESKFPTERHNRQSEEKELFSPSEFEELVKLFEKIMPKNTVGTNTRKAKGYYPK